MVLSVNGDMIGVRPALAGAMDAAGRDFLDAAADRRGAARRPPAARLRLGVPFPFSMHAELVSYWLERAGRRGGGASSSTDPAAADGRGVAAGEIDAFCVGEPWGSVAVERGAAELILPGAAIWRFAPEKVLAMPREAVRAEPETRRGADARGLAGGALDRRPRRTR